jgi:non-canonical purine NTP pyrophosphatase (RdgB/HAM1 family)
MNLNYVTTNEYKFRNAQTYIEQVSGGSVVLSQIDLETPEIQSESVTEISEHSALWAARELGAPVVAMDVSFAIEGLNGFPGPFIKYINNWLSPEDILSMLQRKKSKSAEFVDSITYATPNGLTKTFTAVTPGNITEVKTIRESSSTVDSLFVPLGQTKTLSELSDFEKSHVWNTRQVWSSLVEYLIAKELEE